MTLVMGYDNFEWQYSPKMRGCFERQEFAMNRYRIIGIAALCMLLAACGASLLWSAGAQRIPV